MSVVIFMLAYKYLVHEIEKSIQHKQKFNNNSNQQTCLIPPAPPQRTEIKVFFFFNNNIVFDNYDFDMNTKKEHHSFFFETQSFLCFLSKF